MSLLHEEIGIFKSINEYFEDESLGIKEVLEDLRSATEEFGYELNDHDMKYMVLRELLDNFIQLGIKEKAYNMLDLIHVLKYEEYSQKIKKEFTKFDPSKRWSNTLKKVYFVQIRKTMDDRFMYVYPYTNFVKDCLNSDNSDLHINWSNLEESIQEFDNDIHDVWLGEPFPMADLGDIIYPPMYFPVLFFEKDTNENKADFEFFNNYKIAWQPHWDDLTFDEIGRRAAALLDNSLYRAFPELNMISITPYEGEECKGFLLINDETPDVELHEPVRLDEHKRIRKLLEISDGNLILLVKPLTLIAYGFKVKKNNKEKFNGIFIEFKSKFNWHCSIDNTPIFHSDNSQIRLPITDAKDIDPMEIAIKNVFKNSSKVTDRDIILLNKLVVTAKQQKKGTILVILEEQTAKDEALRLTQSCTRITPKKLNIQLLNRFSGIDGAIILDNKGVCHAIGVILDGEIDTRDPGRGARYNSSLRYFKTKENAKIPCLLVVVSEDGHISILPDELEN